MKPVEVSKAARQDWRTIWYYIAEDSADAADRFSESIKKELRLLSDFPNSGHHRSDCRRATYRFWRVDGSPYLIAYRNMRSKVIIARIVHGARDFRELFK